MLSSRHAAGEMKRSFDDALPGDSVVIDFGRIRGDTSRYIDVPNEMLGWYRHRIDDNGSFATKRIFTCPVIARCHFTVIHDAVKEMIGKPYPTRWLKPYGDALVILFRNDLNEKTFIGVVGKGCEYPCVTEVLKK